MKASLFVPVLLIASLSVIAQETTQKHSLLITPGVSYNGSGDILLGGLSGQYNHSLTKNMALLSRAMIAQGTRTESSGHFTSNEILTLEVGLNLEPKVSSLDWIGLEFGLSLLKSTLTEGDAYTKVIDERNSKSIGGGLGNTRIFKDQSFGFFTGMSFRLIQKEHFESGLNIRMQRHANGDVINTLGLFFGASF
jgi:hypothetical protein